MRKIFYLIIGLLFGCRISTFAQNMKASGTVTDAKDGSALFGVTIKIKGSSITTVTRQDGGFTLNVPANSSKVLFSYVGYEPLEMPIGSLMNVTMIPVDSSFITNSGGWVWYENPKRCDFFYS